MVLETSSAIGPWSVLLCTGKAWGMQGGQFLRQGAGRAVLKTSLGASKEFALFLPSALVFSCQVEQRLGHMRNHGGSYKSSFSFFFIFVCLLLLAFQTRSSIFMHFQGHGFT